MANADSDASEETTHKLAVVARVDLGMSSGKLASQVGHAVAETFEGGAKKMIRAWQDDGGTIVVLQVSGEPALEQLKTAAKKQGVKTWPVIDYGLTEVEDGTLTALAVGPDLVGKVDGVTGRLELLRNLPEAAGKSAGDSESTSHSALELENLRSRLRQAEAEASELRSRFAPVSEAAPATLAPAACEFRAELRAVGRALEAACVPDLFELWTWEGDETCLPSKWEQALEECCEEDMVPSSAERPWEAPDFDKEGIFFLTSRSETCGVALTQKVGCNGYVTAWGVKPWCRRRGLGRCLLRLCLQRLVQLDCSKVFMSANPTRFPDAWRLLQQEGFCRETS